MSRVKCGFTRVVSQKLWGRGEETTGRSNHTEYWKHPHPPQVTQCVRGMKRKPGSEGCRAVGTFRCCCRAGDRQRAVVVKRRDACWGLRLSIQWGKVWCWRARSPSSTSSSSLSSSPLSSRAYLTDKAMAFNPEREKSNSIKLIKHIKWYINNNKIKYVTEISAAHVLKLKD